MNIGQSYQQVQDQLSHQLVMMSELKLGLLKLEVKSEVRLNIGQSYQQVQDQLSHQLVSISENIDTPFGRTF